MEKKITAWIARDKNGSLYLSDKTPKKYKECGNIWDNGKIKNLLTIKICK